MVNRQSNEGVRRDGGLFWQRVLEAHSASGLTVKEFCENEGLAVWRFYYWRKKLWRSVKAPSAGQATLEDQAQVKAASRFKQIAEVSPSPVEFRIEFPDGILLHIPDRYDPSRLQQVIDLLRERAC